MTPVRADPGLGAATNWIKPPPVPAAPAVNLIQSTVLTAVQLHGPLTMMRIFPAPPSGPNTCVGGVRR